MPIRVRRIEDPEGCELDSPDHRGELYEVEMNCTGGLRLAVVLCRHHLRTLRQTIVEV